MKLVRHPVAVAAAVVLLGASTAIAALAPPSGSPAGMSLARMVQRAYLQVQAQSYAERGFVWMSATQGKSSSFRWMYAVGSSPGLYPASEHAVVALSHGRVSWWRDDLTPAPCSTPGICARIPVEIVVNAQGMFYAFGNASKHTCYGPLSGTTPYIVGKPVWFLTGHFQAPVLAGSTMRLTSTYPWAKTQRATELDTIATRSHRLLRAHVTVSASTGSQAAPFSYAASYHYPSSVPPPPAINLCG